MNYGKVCLVNTKQKIFSTKSPSYTHAWVLNPTLSPLLKAMIYTKDVYKTYAAKLTKLKENAIGVTEESTLLRGEPNIIVKVCISLKMLLIVTFNVKDARIQSSKCSHPVKIPFLYGQKPAFYQSTKPLCL